MSRCGLPKEPKRSLGVWRVWRVWTCQSRGVGKAVRPFFQPCWEVSRTRWLERSVDVMSWLQSHMLTHASQVNAPTSLFGSNGVVSDFQFSSPLHFMMTHHLHPLLVWRESPSSYPAPNCFFTLLSMSSCIWTSFSLSKFCQHVSPPLSLAPPPPSPLLCRPHSAGQSRPEPPQNLAGVTLNLRQSCRRGSKVNYLDVVFLFSVLCKGARIINCSSGISRSPSLDSCRIESMYHSVSQWLTCKF